MKIELAIRAYLEEHGITHAFIARECRWSKQKANAILNGKQKIKACELEAVCRTLDVPYDYFYNMAAEARDTA